MKQRNNRARQQWLATFEQHVLATRPDLSGRIDWDTAVFLFNSGLSPNDAAARFLASLAPTPGKD